MEWLDILIVILEYRGIFAVITEIVGSNLRIFHYPKIVTGVSQNMQRYNNLKIQYITDTRRYLIKFLDYFLSYVLFVERYIYVQYLTQ